MIQTNLFTSHVTPEIDDKNFVEIFFCNYHDDTSNMFDNEGSKFKNPAD